MSAVFFLKFRDAYVQLTFVTGKTVAQIVGRDQATPFVSEADAWLACHQHHLRSDWCEVVGANAESRKQKTEMEVA